MAHASPFKNTLVGNNVLTTRLPDSPYTVCAATMHVTGNVARHAYLTKRHFDRQPFKIVAKTSL